MWIEVLERLCFLASLPLAATAQTEGGGIRVANDCIISKERLAGDRFWEIMGFIAYFWLAHPAWQQARDQILDIWTRGTLTHLHTASPITLLVFYPGTSLHEARPECNWNVWPVKISKREKTSLQKEQPREEKNLVARIIFLKFLRTKIELFYIMSWEQISNFEVVLRLPRSKCI